MRAPALMTNWAVVQEGSWAGLRILHSLRNKHGTLLSSLVTAVLRISGAPLFCSMLKSLEDVFYGILFNSCYLKTLTCSAVHLELKFLTEVKILPSCATPKLAGPGDSEAWRAWQWGQALHSDSVSVWTPLVSVQTWAGWRENTRRFSPSLPLAECFNPLYCLWYPRPANISAQLSCILSFHCFSYNKTSHTLYFSSLRLKSLPVKKIWSIHIYKTISSSQSVFHLTKRNKM